MSEQSEMIYIILHTGDANPSANSYTLPSMLGHHVVTKNSAPAYTLSARGADEALFRTPGPGRYDEVKSNVVAGKAPAYSILGRNYYVNGKGKIS